MTTTRKRRRYLATVAKGEAISLQGDKSDVKLEIQEGCPKRAYLMEVRTDLSGFDSIIPDNECFISPIVEVLAPAETSTSSFTLQIPHCLDENDDKTKVNVRMIHENRIRAVVEVPKGNTAGPLYYDIDARYIVLHITHFTKIICTTCQKAYHCLEKIVGLFFAKFETQEQKVPLLKKVPGFLKIASSSQHDVEIRPYFCGTTHTFEDFKEVLMIFQNYSFFMNYSNTGMGTTFQTVFNYSVYFKKCFECLAFLFLC